MPNPRTRPSRRRERGLKASTLVTGFPASDILHGDRRAVLLPCRVPPPPKKDGTARRGEDYRLDDHPRRYAVGMRLAVREMVPGPVACHVRLIDVKGKREQFHLGDVTRPIAKELGQVRLDVFWRAWILNHDQDWFVRELTDDGVSDEAIAERFDHQWAGKLAWLLRFDVETSQQAPRLLAQSGGSDSFKLDADKRWVYSPRDTDRDEDRGYTTSPATSLVEELPALSDVEWDTHVGPKSGYRAQDRLARQRASREDKSVTDRLAWAKSTAREKGYDIRDELRRYDRHVQRNEPEKAQRQLELIEARVFPSVAA